MNLDLVCDVLDKRVVDRNGRAMGRVDGIVLECRTGKPPRVSALLVGPSALGHRLSPALGRWVAAIERSFGIAEGRPARIAFTQVTKTEPDVKVDLAVGDTAVGVVEQKLRRWIVALSGSVARNFSSAMLPVARNFSSATLPEIRLDRLLGREVLAGNSRPIGRLEEFRADVRNGECVITEYVMGPAALLERLDLNVRLLFAPLQRGYVARWDQLDISDELRPRLTCPVSELQKL